MSNKIYIVLVSCFIFLPSIVFGQQKELSGIALDSITQVCPLSSTITLSSSNIAMSSNIEILYSTLPVKEVIDRLQRLLLAKGITIYARIDQHAEAARSGVQLPELEFILFGNPKAGGVLMSLNPLTALDLPLKVIAWRVGEDRTAIAYNSIDFLANRYNLGRDILAPVDLSLLIKQIL